METLGHWVRGPVTMGKLLYEGVQDFLWEMLMLCVALATIQGMAWYIDFRRRSRKIDYKAYQGIKKDPKFPEEWATKFGQYVQERSLFMGHLVRIVGRKLYRTERGLRGNGTAEHRV